MTIAQKSRSGGSFAAIRHSLPQDAWQLYMAVSGAAIVPDGNGRLSVEVS